MAPQAELTPLRYPPKTAWWKSCFEDAERRQHVQHVRARVDGMASILELEPRSRVLDLGCGLGQETLELARRGHRVLGADLSEACLREGRAGIKDTGLFCHFMKADMRNIPYSSEFDAVVMRHPSFGRPLRERDDLKGLESVRKALKPEGRLLMKLVNRDWVMRELPLVPAEHGIRFDFETGRLSSRESRESFRLYTLTEILRLVSEAGLAFDRAWGRFDGTPYGLDAFHMIVLAHRPVDAERPRDEDDDLPRALKIKGRGR